MVLPHRVQAFEPPCAVCKLPTTAACQRCGRPLCAAHQPRAGFRCARCERHLEEILAPEASQLERARAERLAGQRGARWALSIPVALFASLLALLAVTEGSVAVGVIAALLGLAVAGQAAATLPAALAARRSRRKLARFLAEHRSAAPAGPDRGRLGRGS